MLQTVTQLEPSLWVGSAQIAMLCQTGVGLLHMCAVGIDIMRICADKRLAMLLHYACCVQELV
jgi:hypothetical protein